MSARCGVMGVTAVVMLTGWTAAASAGQTAAPADPYGVAANPLECWWRISTGAVWIGQPLSLVLTCAMADTDTSPSLPTNLTRSIGPAITAVRRDRGTSWP